MNTSRTIYFNGQKYILSRTKTLANLIQYFNYTTEILVIVYNDQIYNKETWNKIKLLDNDKIEIITIVGGG